MRGKLIQQIIDEQIEPALALRPDLITISAGGNDVIRPGTDPDEISARFEYAIERLSRDHATIVIFTGVDVGFSPVFRGIRGKVAIYNENLRSDRQRSTTASSPTSGRSPRSRTSGCGRPTGCT